MDVDDEDGRNGDDPLKNGGFTLVTEKRKLRSNQNKYDQENGVDNKRNKTMQTMNKNTNTITTQGQNGDTQTEIGTDKLTHTNAQLQPTAGTSQNTLDKTTLTERNTKLTARQLKDQTDARYSDGWIKNTDYTTFIIEREIDDKAPKNAQNVKDSYPHPMEVAKMLANIKANSYKQMKSVGRGRFQLTFSKPRDAEQLINSKLLTEQFKFKVYVPTRFKQTVGVVRDVAKSLTEQDIMENMNSGNIRIEKVERIMKKESETKMVPTYSIKIYAKGENLPKSVEIYGVNARCEPYVFPLKLCFKCWRYGHRQRFCKSDSAKCCKCGLEHEERACRETDLKCINCGGPHKASDRDCPERDRQDKIRVEMATNKTSFFEAQQKFPKGKRTVQGRIDSIRDFPNLPETDNDSTDLDNTNEGARSFARAKPWGNVSVSGRRPQIESVKDKMKIKTQPNKFPQPERYEEEPHVFRPNPYTTTEIERLKDQIKQELLAHFNWTGIKEKIQAIQNTIIHNTAKTETIDQDLLLINISNQLEAIVNPEIFFETRSDTPSNSNYGSE